MVDRVAYGIDLGLSARSLGDDPQSREVHKALHLLAERGNTWIKTASVEVAAGASSVLLSGADVFPEDFDDFIVIGSNIELLAASVVLMQLEIAGTLYTGANYHYASQTFSGAVWVGATGAGATFVPTPALPAASGGFNHYSYLEVGLRSVHGAVSRKDLEVLCRVAGSVGTSSYQLIAAGINQNAVTAPVTGIQFSPSGITFTSGNFTVYGISK